MWGEVVTVVTVTESLHVVGRFLDDHLLLFVEGTTAGFRPETAGFSVAATPPRAKKWCTRPRSGSGNPKKWCTPPLAQLS